MHDTLFISTSVHQIKKCLNFGTITFTDKWLHGVLVINKYSCPKPDYFEGLRLY